MVGEDGIRNRLQTARKLPCVLISELVSNDRSTSTEASEEHLFAVEIWIDAANRRRSFMSPSCASGP